MIKSSSFLAPALAVAVASCAAHDPAIDQRLDTLSTQIAAMQRDISALQQRPAAAAPSNDADVERKLEEMAKKIDLIAARIPSQQAPHRRVEPDRSQVYAIAVDGFPTEGPADAKVTMVLAFDYADPYTEKTRDTRADLRKKYGKDLRIVYRDFVVHPQVATAAAVGGCAAHKQKQFFAYDALAWEDGYKARNFDKTERCWESADGCPVTYGFATKAKLDLAKLKRDMPACAKDVDADMADLKKFAVGATPTFFINGRVLTGAMPIDQFEALIDEELKKTNDRIAAGAKQASYYKDWVLAKGLTSVPQ